LSYHLCLCRRYWFAFEPTVSIFATAANAAAANATAANAAAANATAAKAAATNATAAKAAAANATAVIFGSVQKTCPGRIRHCSSPLKEEEKEVKVPMFYHDLILFAQDFDWVLFNRNILKKFTVN
jgi:hypothetical protein